jgi:hypothetical protein
VSGRPAPVRPCSIWRWYRGSPRRRRSLAGLILEIDVRERHAGVIPHDEAGVRFLDGPRDVAGYRFGITSCPGDGVKMASCCSALIGDQRQIHESVGFPCLSARPVLISNQVLPVHLFSRSAV